MKYLYLITLLISLNAHASLLDINNPGAISKGHFATQHGAIAAKGRWAVFNTWDDGVVAHRELLNIYLHNGYDTVAKIISHYAPPKENRTKLYIKKVARMLHVKPNEKIYDFQIYKLQRSIQYIECGV